MEDKEENPGRGKYPRDEVKHAKQLAALRNHANHKSLAAQIRKDVLREQELLEEQKDTLERINKIYDSIEERLLSKVSGLIEAKLARIDERRPEVTLATEACSPNYFVDIG